MKKKLLIDCDPGQDDFLALLSALALPEVEVVGLSSVAGNLPIETTSWNIGRILTLAGRKEIPYAKGSSHPLLRPQITAEQIHGKTGLGSLQLKDPEVEPVDLDGPDFLYHCAKAHPGLSLLAIGPLTNVARALLGHPELRELLGEIVFMGGGHAWGNTTPKAEFNILADPHAAHIVLGSGIPLTMVGLDATMQRGLSEEEVAALPLHGPCRKYVAQVLQDMIRCYARQGLGQRAYIHDLTALLCCLHPELFRLQPCHITVELHGGHTLGQTVCDLTGVGKKPANAWVALGLLEEPYLALLKETLSML